MGGSMIRRGAVPWAEGEALARQLGAHAGPSRTVVVLRHEGVEAPMACGVVRPAIVLPWDVEAWSASDLRHALIHELDTCAGATGRCTSSPVSSAPATGSSPRLGGVAEAVP